MPSRAQRSDRSLTRDTKVEELSRLQDQLQGTASVLPGAARAVEPGGVREHCDAPLPSGSRPPAPGSQWHLTILQAPQVPDSRPRPSFKQRFTDMPCLQDHCPPHAVMQSRRHKTTRLACGCKGPQEARPLSVQGAAHQPSASTPCGPADLGLRSPLQRCCPPHPVIGGLGQLCCSYVVVEGI